MPKKVIQGEVILTAKEITGNSDKIKIQDQEAYNQYMELQNSKILKMKIQTLSNGKKISLGAIHGVKEAIMKLPIAEQNKITGLQKLYKQTICKMNGAKRRAFGNLLTQEGTISTRSDIFAQRKQEMIELFGRMFTAQEVHQVCIETWGIPCKLSHVKDFRTQHYKEIEPRVEQHKRDYSDIRLGYKRSRLEELTYLYKTRKRTYEETKKSDDHRLLLATLEQIRKECEGDVFRLDGTLNMNIDLTIQEHINIELRKSLPLKEIILGRVCARMGVDGDTIIAQMNKMYYSKFLQAEELDYEEMPNYPSNQTYDFTRIRRVNEQREKEKQNQLPAPKLEEQQHVQAKSIKELILSKLQRKKEKMMYVKNNLDGMMIEKANSNIDDY